MLEVPTYLNAKRLLAARRRSGSKAPQMVSLIRRCRSGVGRRRSTFPHALHPRQWPRIVSAFVLCAGKGMLGLALVVVGGLCSMPAMANVSPRPVVVGAEVLLASGFVSLAGKRVGLIANQTSLANGSHLADLLKAAPGVTLRRHPCAGARLPRR